MRPGLALLIAALPLALAAGEKIVPPEGVAAGVERGGWSLEPLGNSGAAEKSGDPRMLKVIYEAGEKDKTAFKHLTGFGVSRKGAFRVHVYSSDENPPEFGLGISTTVAYVWHETQSQKLKKGWNALTFQIDTRAWKTQESEWKFTARLEPCEDIRAIDLIVYNGKRGGVLYVHGLSYDPDDKGEQVAGLAKKLQSEDAGEREGAEKDLVAIGRPAMEALMQLSDNERPEVLLRAASALRQIENVVEPEPPDPKLRAELAKQREEQRFEETRRRVEYAVQSLMTQKVRVIEQLKDGLKELEYGRAELGQLKHTDEEKKKNFLTTLERLETLTKELEAIQRAAPATAEKKQ